MPVMFMPTVIAALRFIGLQGVIALGVFVFYEGLPLVKSIPFVEYVPVISDLALGRVDRAFQSGELSERLVWQERQRRADLALAAARRATQATIDRIETEYWAKQTDQAIQLQDLEKTLQAERAENADHSACQPGVSKRLRDQLAPIGR